VVVQEAKEQKVGGRVDTCAYRSSSRYQEPLVIDDTKYEADPYIETTIMSPRDGYFSNPEMAYASKSPLLHAHPTLVVI
jgi:hypothetical protein